MKVRIYIVLCLLNFIIINTYSQVKIDTLLRFYDIKNSLFLEKSINKGQTIFYYIDKNGKSTVVDTFVLASGINGFIKKYFNEGKIDYGLSSEACDTLCNFYCVLIDSGNIVKETRIIDIISNNPYPCNELEFSLSTKHDFTFDRFKEFFNKTIRVNRKKYPVLLFHVRPCSD